MSETQKKRKKDDAMSTQQTTNTTDVQVVEDILCEEPPSKKIAMSSQAETQEIEGPGQQEQVREYVGCSTKQRAEYWKDFKVYLSDEGLRRAECNFCPKTFAADPNINGTKNVRKHWFSCPKNPANIKKETQTKLILEHVDDKPGQGKLRNWVLNVSELREALCYMVIIDELPFRFVEKPGFGYMMSKACPEFHLPSRMTVARGCYQLYLKEKNVLKEFLNVACQRVCVTTDSWTSNQRINYMCLTAHFIDNDWNLQKRILNFCPISSHKGKAIAKAIEVCLEGWGLDTKLYTVTVDNASSNDVACSHLIKTIQNKSCISNGKYLHMRCVAHIVNLIVWDGLRMKNSIEAVEKVRAVVKFVRNSPARLQRFKDFASVLKIESKALLSLDVPTRWNSTYTMLSTAVKFERVFGMFELHKEPEFKEPDSLGPPGEADWDLVKRLVVFLEKFYVLTNNVSASLSVTCNSALFDIGTALETLKALEETYDPELIQMASKMREKFNKYWGSLDKFNLLIYVAAILDPKIKIVGLQFALHDMYGEKNGNTLFEKIQAATYDLFDEYKSLYCPVIAPPAGSSSGSASKMSDAKSMKNNILEKVRLLKTSVGSKGKYMSSRPELERYLNEDVGEEDVEILMWWKFNSPRFPVLSRMARDILAMPISTVASESAFSTGGRTLDQFRSSLTPRVCILFTISIV